MKRFACLMVFVLLVGCSDLEPVDDEETAFPEPTAAQQFDLAPPELPPPPAPRPPAPPPPAAEPYYANCDAVRAAGAAPIRPGDPGFRSAFDRDGDGIGCE